MREFEDTEKESGRKVLEHQAHGVEGYQFEGADAPRAAGAA